MANKREQEIKNLMKQLDITREEAMEVIAFDKGDIGNEVVEAIEAGIAQVADEKKRSPIEKVKYSKAKKKADANKEGIVSAVFEFLKFNALTRGVQKMTATKISFADKDGNFYTVTVTKHKAKPDGYNGGIEVDEVEVENA